MFCPNYKNREVFDQFNQIVESLGGKRMTEEEFRSVDLRNQRSGSDFVAMDTAYKIWNLNNGNPLTETPNGQQSKLYAELVKAFDGDVLKATKAKAQVYSEYFREWFGDWLSEDKSNVSKVVDENGEPLVVWHHTNNENLTEFEQNYDNYFSQMKGGTKHAMFFTTNSQKILDRKYSLPLFLSLKTPFQYSGTKESMHEQGTSYTELVNNAEEVQGAIFTGLDDNRLENQTVLVAYNPNQIKSINNNGNFSTKDNNIYHQEEVDDLGLSLLNPFQAIGNTYTFLQRGEVVNSNDVINELLDSGSFDHDKRLKGLARMLSYHNIPVKMVSVSAPILMSTVTNEKGNVIVLNERTLNRISKDYFAETIIHEMVHAITVNAITNPNTKEEIEFSKSSNRVYELAKKSIKYSQIPVQFDHAFENSKEFAAYLATDKAFRTWLFESAREKRGLIQNIKDLLNKFFRVILNRNVFAASNEEQFKQYYSDLISYMDNKSNNVKVTKKAIKEIYENIDHDGLLMEEYIESTKQFMIHSGLEINHQLHMVERQNFNQNVKKLDDAFSTIVRILNIRQLALNSAALPESEKTKLKFSVEQQIAQFENEQLGKHWATINLIRQVGPQIVEDSKLFQRVLEGKEEMSDSEFQYHVHDNIAAYKTIFDKIMQLLQPGNEAGQGFRELIQDSIEKGENITEEDVQLLIKQVQAIRQRLNWADNALEVIRKNNIKRTVEELTPQIGTHELLQYYKDYIETNSLDEDISWFALHLGSADSSVNPMIKTLDYLVRSADRKVEELTNERATKLIQLESKLKGKENVFDCYELDDDGNTTGYLVRKRNYGKFYKNYNNQLKVINNFINDIYKTDIKEDNRNVPSDMSINITPQIEQAVKDDFSKLQDGDELFEIWKDLPDSNKVRYHWFTKRNYWLGDNCHRRYTRKYYQAWASLSNELSSQLQALNIRMSAIRNLPGVKDENGYLRLDRLTKEQLEEYENLKIQKKLLGSELNEYGERKMGIELQYAKEIQRFHKMLYGDKKTVSKNKAAWEQARLDIIRECGGTEAYQKYKNGEENHGFDYKKLDNWDKFNSSLEMKTDANGNWLVFNAINEMIQGNEPDFGEEYRALEEELNELLRPYKFGNEYRPSLMTEKVKNKATKLAEKLNAIKRSKLNTSKTVRRNNELRGKAFAEYIEFVENTDFKKIKSSELAKYADFLGDEMLQFSILSKFGKKRYTPEGDVAGIRFHKWFTKMVVKPKYREQFMELNPSDSWLDFSSENQNIDTEFDENEKQAWVPKLKNKDGSILYDNSKQFDKVNKEGTALNNYYNAIKETISESNSLQTSRGYTDDYMLPQIMNTALESLLQKNSFKNRFIKFWYHVKKRFGLLGEEDEDVKRYGQLESFEQDETNETFNKKDFSTYGSRADGKSYNVIPLSYVGKMEDPTQISRELTMITCMYYQMSANFSEKLKIKDKCETIIDQLKSKEAVKTTGSRKVVVPKERTKTSEFAEAYLKHNLYGQDYSKNVVYGFDMSKAVMMMRQYTTARNLGMNPKVALVGMFSSLFAHTVNMVVGQKYSMSIGASAAKEVSLQIIKSLIHGSDVSNPLTNNKLIGLHEFCNIADQGTKKFRNTSMTLNGYKRFAEVIRQNWCFGMMSTCDFISKSNVVVATFMSYHLVDGKFVTKDDLRLSKVFVSHTDKTKQNEWLAQQEEKWDNGVSLYDVLNMKDNMIQCDPKYLKAFNEVKHNVISRAKNYSEAADGMAQKTQKTLFAHGVIGSLVLIHRQYLPLMLQERFGQRTFDYNTHQMKNGQWRTLLRFINNFAFDSIIGGAISGAAAGSVFGFGIGSLVGAGIGVGISIRKGNKKILHNPVDAFNKFFNQSTGDTQYEAYMKNMDSYLNRYQMKQIMFESFIAIPLLNLLAGYVGALADDDKDDELLNFISLVLDGTLWESMSASNLLDIVSALKSPSATLSSIDQFIEVMQIFAETSGATILSMISIPELENILISLFGESSLYDGSMSGEIKKGEYKNHSKMFKSTMKLTPFKNTYEQWKNSSGKRRYIENQMFNEKPSRLLYNVFNNQDSNEDYDFDYYLDE